MTAVTGMGKRSSLPRQRGAPGLGACAILLAVSCARTGLNVDSHAGEEGTHSGGAALGGAPTRGEMGGQLNGGAVTVNAAGGTTGSPPAQGGFSGGPGTVGGNAGAPQGSAGEGGDTMQTVAVVTCPPTDAPGVGTNTWITAEVPGGIDPTSPPTLTVVCADVPVAGESLLDGNRAAFVPEAPLPENATCIASLGDGATNASGIPVEAVDWTFNTGDVPQTSFAWSTPRSLGEGYPAALASSGDTLIAGWTGMSLVMAVSRNNGETFEDPISLDPPNPPDTSQGAPHIHPVVVRLNEETAHVAWRSLPVNSPGFAYYARLVDGLSRAETPRELVAPVESANIIEAALGFDGDQQVRVAWNGTICDPICSGPYALWAAASDDGGDTFTQLGRIDDGEASGPAIAWTDDGMLTAWIDDDRLLVHDEAGEQVASLSETGGQIWPFTFLPFADGRALLSWREGPGIGIQTSFLSRFENGAFTSPRALLSEPDDRTSMYSRFGVSPGDDVLWLAALGDVFGPVERSVRLSTNAGETFSAPQTLDFLHDAGHDPDGDDSFCPVIALGANGLAHLLWTRNTYEPGGFQLLYSRGTPSAPCGF